jgi:hypothetical protein
MKLTTKLALFALFSVLLMTGCTVFPIYRPAATEVTTPLKVSGWGIITFRLCTELDKDRRQLDIDPKTLTTRIPTGKCLMVNAYRSASGYQVTHYCNARLAFDPEPGTTYVLNSGMVDQGKCFIELVKEELSTDTGVVLEPSVRRAW